MEPGSDNKPTVLWTVRGSGWSFFSQGPECACPTEVATVAVERVWGEVEGDDWRKSRQAGELRRDENRSGELGIGIALEVWHERMKTRDEHIIVPSCLALANAGFHGDAERLRREWDQASEESKLGALADLLGWD